MRAVLDTYELTELTDTAELLASELVTNAQRHTGSPYSFRRVGGKLLWVECGRKGREAE